ncbi:protein eiger [Culicoides brevitarsis]|uniref:protein eiger n=1 Tax=Culicoides brevitarsis TaxID=469753 RepID=UPI00307B63F0
MTAETLKPFLSLTNGNMLTPGNNDATDTDGKRSKTTFLLFLFAGLVLIFTVTVLSLLIIYIVKVNDLEKKVGEIEHKLVETRKHFRFAEYDELKDLDDFEDTYNRNRHVDDAKDERRLYGKEKNVPEEYDDETFLDEDFGSGDYAYDDEDEDDSLELYSDENDNEKKISEESDKNNIYDDILKSELKRTRHRRALAGLTRQGVPIMEESYLERRNRTSNEYLDPLLTSNRPRMKLDWNDANHPRRYHHQQSHHNAHEIHNQHHAALPVHHKHRQDDKIVLTDRNGVPRGYAQESIQAPVEYAMPPVRPITAAKAGKPRTALHKFAVQLVRDPRITSQHGHHVRQGIIYNDWMVKQSHNMPHIHHFMKIDAGVVKIKVEGLYYVYAQISYDSNMNTNSFVIERNQSPELQCSLSPTIYPNPSTCFTAGTLYLKSNDMIYVKDLNSHKSNIKDPHKSYFGIIKLA